MAPNAASETGNAADAYYAYIKRTTQTKMKVEPPDNLIDVATAFDSHPSFKKQFVGFSTMLAALFKRKVSQRRKLNAHEIKADPKQLKSPSKTNGVSRSTFVPEVFKQCSSVAAKSAVAMFCLLPFKETIRRDVLFAILQDAFNTVDEIVKLASDNIKTIRATVSGSTACPDETRKTLIQALLETSDALRDRNYSRLAMAVHPKIYVLAIRFYIEKKPFASIYPYDALINKYIQTCVASKSQALERDKIVNQFDVNAYAIVENMIGSLPEKNESHKSARFDEARTYHVFEGPTNFPRDLAYTYRKFNGKLYQIVTYKDCLYDVIGTEDELFINKTWPERLASIGYSTKIIIQEIIGTELKDYSGNATLAASWMEDGRFHCKHITFAQRDKRTNKN